MIDPQCDVSIRKQCQFLAVPRSGYYDQTMPIQAFNGMLMNEIHEIWHRTPFYGYRRITHELRKQGYTVNHKRVQRLMNQMNLHAIYPKPKPRGAGSAHETYPYLLNEVTITGPDQVWATDITYIPMARGFVYLVALLDLYSRYIVAWQLSISLEAAFCVAMLESALARGRPDIVNSDQGCQFTSSEWINTLTTAKVRISMDGKGRCMDNIYIERFWRSLKYEEIYLDPPRSVGQAREHIQAYIEFYNHRRGHQSLQYQTPGALYGVDRQAC